MQTTALPGGTDRPPRTTPARIPDKRSVVPGLPAAAFLLTALLGLPVGLRAQQPSGAASGGEVNARVAVEPVVMVSPGGPVAVSFPSASPSSGEPVEARTTVGLSCAGNTAHAARIRRVLPGGSTSSASGGELQWATDRGAGWVPLGTEPSRVVGPLEAGRRDDCATVRFRWVPRDAGPPAEVSVAFEGVAAAPGEDGRTRP